MRNLLIVVFLLSISIVSVEAAVIFSEDFDSIADGWNCSDSLPVGWSTASACPSYDPYAVGHYAGEITSGGRSGNSLKLWRRNSGIWDDGAGYYGYINYDPLYATGYKEIYMRYYIKIDQEIGTTGSPSSAQPKFTRFYANTTQSIGGAEMLMNVVSDWRSGGFKNYTIQFSGSLGNYYTQDTITGMGLNDGGWHSVELRYKLESTASANDGALQFWVDGVEQVLTLYGGSSPTTGKINIDTGTTVDHAFVRTVGPGIGNLTDASWNMDDSAWHSFEWDDYIVSTTYIGVDTPPTGPTTPLRAGARIDPLGRESITAGSTPVN